MDSRRITQAALAALSFCMAGGVGAQGIYTCIDGSGRKITADRPILECNDRVQKEMTKSGNVKRVLVPVPTPQEKALQDEKDKRVAEERAREADEKRRDRALLLRYPHLQAHNKERAQALEQIDEVIKAALKRITELGDQRKAMQADLEFYKGDPAKAPPLLKRQIEENEGGVAAQKRFIAEQELEKKRVTRRFDDELVKLKQLWPLTGGVPQPAVVKK
jgi:hypothetical protein